MEKERQTDLGLFSFLTSKDIRFNPTPWVKKTPSSDVTIKFDEESSFDLHAEVVGKVDALIALNEKETWSEEPELVSKLKK